MLETETLMVPRCAYQIPAAKALTINTPVLLFSDESRPIILGEVFPSRRLPSLILDLCRNCILRQWRQYSILVYIIRTCECLIIKSPQCSKFSQYRQSTVDKVLISSSKTVEDDPMHLAFCGVELDVDVVTSSFDDFCTCPREIAGCSVC